jgi:hypothetical protein
MVASRGGIIHFKILWAMGYLILTGILGLIAIIIEEGK